MLTVQTELLTLNKIFDGGYQFSIPSYQRPYVWSDDDVLLLFNDVKTACENGDEHYFIGTVLSSKLQSKTGLVYELIDGQQRTTTLMLIAIAFKAAGVKSDLNELAVYMPESGKAIPRLQFAIRDQVQLLLGGLAGLKGYEKPSQEVIDNNEYLKQIGIALKVLSEHIEALDKHDKSKAEKLGQYFYTSVQWVNNIVPAKMDLNRLFATMNTAGVQLEQADILKAKLFKHIKTDKAQYDAMWVACEHLENYFERNVRKVFPDVDWNNIEPQDLAVFNDDIFYHPESQEYSDDDSGFSIDELSQILASGKTPENVKQKVFETYDLDIETTYCRSIIKFPLFLIHAYRVYLALNNKQDIKPRLHSDRLLEIFTPLIKSDEETVKSFIEMLWQVRYQFDAWIVKWVERDDSPEAHLGLTYQSRSKSKDQYYINRPPKEITALALLQSVRNFTGERSAQYWITSFITELIQKEISAKQENKALRLLERIDNRMSLATCSQKEASFKQAKSKKPARVSWFEQKSYFDDSKGTSFEHYWFQKLEYLLWKQLNNSKAELNKSDLIKFKKYRITSKNSVEHVHPQNDEYKSHLSYETLNAFGNLVLLSPGENSSYSNQDVDKKQIDFERKQHFDSLKLRDMFIQKGNNSWDQTEIEAHQKRMLDVLETHYGDKE
ncbi:DUF262 domain-containing protein [Pseudoalteromonas piscicida]|uniref:DUF262 domain-containing protein n=1 Tax=Pseudoalteromonas piscicida TaxID=43662 RepID=A0AAQ2EXW1_PSEO7|nr:MULTISPECIES: DUF262 domain-containing protein [Pseudoalteromonas]KJY89721.1 hypothetical protein TW75_09185 [Pseudoalteromonas piscicida]TMN36538.1 DUF262 domain-containing protein [Pseudoalteromonas piscicida]TMN40070.1 DUF262 domain-containing protein [Pseudoalteromonas piscicida]TMN54125.1 DUF262 domain-containing protein [Pseudoalteromonas piscicida]TMN55909.1 DUF262 domain-containing protein [Pseudoalteromonas piscicida]